MKSKLAALLLASATLGAGPVLFTPTAVQAADVEVSFDFFNDSLSPYGDWIEVGDYGLCWKPNDVDADWAPYTDGYWSYTDAGWTWVSYEDFGGITYHYGRWVNVEDEGWCWVPDYEWGPAWVSWRNSDEYVGWAPLPPEARWEPEVGFSVWVDNSYDIGPSYYNFCPVEDFGAPVIREVILPRPRNVFIIQNTVNITNITVNKFVGVPFCGGPRFDFISTRVRRPIPALKLVRETNITNIYNNTVINKTVIKNGNRRVRAITAAQQGNQLIVPAPRIKRVANPLAALPNVKPVRTIGAAKVNRGWNQVKDTAQRDQLRQKMVQETKGLRRETAPARPIETAELKPVPEKADPNAPSPVATAGRGKRNGNGKNGRENAAGFAPGEPTPGTAGPADANQPGVADGRQKGRGPKGEKADNAAVQPEQPGGQMADADDNKPGKQGRGNNDRKERGENTGVAGGNRGPLKPFNGGDAPNAGATAGADNSEAARKERLEKLRKENEQVARAAEVQEEFRKRQKQQQAQQGDRPQRPQQQQEQNENAPRPERPDVADRAERRQEAQAAAAEARREQQARAARQEAAREQAGERAERQREAMAERQREAQSGAQEARREQRQEAFERRQQQMQSEAQEQRRQQGAAAAQARREQMEAAQRQQARQQQMEAMQERAQAARQQQMEAQREAQRQMQAQRMEQMQRQQQFQRQQQAQQQQQAQRQGGNGGGRPDGERRGRRGQQGEEQ